MTTLGGTQGLVSVIVPVYNGARYLAESLDSILAQTYAPIEVIVMDDASTDDTAQIAGAYGARVQYHRNDGNLGQFSNVNAGIARARGEFIAVYHADDIYDPTIVEREITCFRQWPELGAVFCRDIFVDADGREYGRLSPPPELCRARPLDFAVVFNALLTYQNAFLVCPGAMVRAAVYREVGAYRPDPWRESADLEMWIRISQRFPLLVLEEYLLKYRHYPNQAHRRYNRLRTDAALHFVMMDRFLQEGARRIATREALRAHEVHRAQDRLMNAVNLYILDDLRQARFALSEVRLRTLLGSPHVKRARMVAVYVMFHIVCRLRRVAIFAVLFEWRWQSGRIMGAHHPLAGLGTALRRWWYGKDKETCDAPASIG